MVQAQLQIDPELKHLIPPLKPEEYTALEQSLLTEGCRDSLVVWQNTIVDGHNRYELCRKHNIPYTVVEKDFASRDDVIIWMIQNQLARRNITDFWRAELVLKQESIVKAIQAKAKANRVKSGELFGENHPKEVYSNLNEPLASVNTNTELAKLAETSVGTLHKVKKVLEKAPESIKAMARAGAISTDKAHKLTEALANAPDDVQAVALQYADSNPDKVDILKDLYKSRKNENSNATFDEIALSGGFHYGDELEDWCDFQASRVQDILKALKSLSDHQRRIAQDVKRHELVQTAEAAVSGNMNILTGDMQQLFDYLPDNSVDLFFTDPPYGEDYLPQWLRLSELAACKLKPGALLLSYSGQAFLPQVMAHLATHLTYWWMFAVRQTDSALAIWNKQLQVKWKPVLVYQKPSHTTPLSMPEWCTDFIEGGGRKKEFHQWGQAASEATYWIEKFTVPGALVCDPFVGGGSIPVACKLTGRNWIGTEIDVEQAQIARLHIQEASA